MKYLGGKFRLKKDINKIIKEYREKDQVFASPFCGSCWVEMDVQGERLLYDKHYYLIEMWKALQRGWIPPKECSEEEYKRIKNNLDENPALSGFIGFGSSYGGKWFGGYARGSTGRNYTKEAYNSVIKKIDKMKSAKFEAEDFRNLSFDSCIIYCDPPYENTTPYATNLLGKFNHAEFWEKAREWSKSNIVLVSEFQAPDDFICIWEKEGKTDLGKNDGTKKDKIERVFLKKPE